MQRDGAEKRLVWQSEYEAQRLQEKRFFQHFTGAHTKLWKKVKAFPLLLWAEQAQALAAGVVPDKASGQSAGHKRKRSSAADDAEEDGQLDNRRTRVRAEDWFHSAAALFRMVADAVLSPFAFVAGMVSHSAAGGGRAVANPAASGSVEAKKEEDTAAAVHQEWRTRVFMDLTAKGYLVGPGAAYGGDYVIYRNDPQKEHSMACVRIIYDGCEPLYRDVATFARVCRKARKTAVLALGRLDGSVKYISAGFAGVISYAKNKGKTQGARRKFAVAQTSSVQFPDSSNGNGGEPEDAADSDSDADEGYFSDVSADS